MSEALFGALVGATINDVSSTDYWYDYYHHYLTYDEQYTTIIDDILMSKDGEYSTVGPKKVISSTRKVPGLGKHYYYNFRQELRTFPRQGCLSYKENYIGLEKILENEKKVIWFGFLLQKEVNIL